MHARDGERDKGVSESHGTWLTFGRSTSSLRDKTDFTETQEQSAPHQYRNPQMDGTTFRFPRLSQENHPVYTPNVELKQWSTYVWHSNPDEHSIELR